ncbi:hypothetical protein [Solirubrum puertoriconensis]|uniref:Uncharacterized protein n=1 Tax=Solirubrum puertoriconensis TaxID=1751427 RepID=A0A9X0L399_SOLP1|nr:hypothetical protein [Solirubrum puertoriconensis]KUG06276.1 hypothetical protein ASU33_02635 [Solirubrum puertoriconensis]
MLDTNADDRVNRGQSQRVAMRYFVLLMAAVYVGLGTFLLVAPAHMFALPPTTRRIVGGLFVLYGLIRFFRTFRQHFRNRHDSLQR